MTENHLLPISVPQYEKQPSCGLSLLVGERRLPLHSVLIMVNWSGSFASWVLENFTGHTDAK